MKIQNRSRTCLCVSIGIMVIALVMSIFGYGLNYGIDFAGGLTFEYDMNTAFVASDVEAVLAAQGITDYKVASTGDDGEGLQLRIAQVSDDAEIQTIQTGLEEALLVIYPDMDTSSVVAGYVGPVAGATLVRNAIMSVILASLLMLIYIAIRFDFSSGLAAVIGLLHDVLVMLSFMVLLRNFIQINSSFIAAMLTIVGYSINNTIVIFDRIRENHRKPAYHGLKREEVVNISVKESLGRTINTTLTTLVTIVTLYVLGVDTIREFSLPIIVGIISGVYSANMINGYVWAELVERIHIGKPKKKVAPKKA